MSGDLANRLLETIMELSREAGENSQKLDNLCNEFCKTQEQIASMQEQLNSNDNVTDDSHKLASANAKRIDNNEEDCAKHRNSIYADIAGLKKKQNLVLVLVAAPMLLAALMMVFAWLAKTYGYEHASKLIYNFVEVIKMLR